MLEQVLSNALNPDVKVSSSQLQDLMEMFASLMFLRKVNPFYWFEIITLCTRGIVLAATVRTEALMCQAEGTTDEHKKIAEAAIKLSLQEIREVRLALVKQLDLMKQMAPVGTKLN